MSIVFDPEAVERELVTLQRRLSPSETRTALYNLVIVSRPEHDAHVEKALGYLLGKRPARIVRIRMTDDPASGIRVSARCFPDRENLGVCFQEIHIDSGTDGTGAATGTWTPLLIREIPVYLWWMDRLVPPPELMYRSLEHVDKVLIDSFTSETSGEDACSVFGGFVCDALRGEVPVADMAWRKTAILRQATAQLFDTDTTRPLLGKIRHVDIRGGTKVTALLFLSWLSDRLRWSIPEPGMDGGHPFTGPGGETISWRHTEASPFENGLTVEFGLDPGKGPAVRTDPGGFAELSVPGVETHTIPFPIPEDGRLLLEEFDYPYHDYLFAEVVRNVGCVFSGCFSD